MKYLILRDFSLLRTLTINGMETKRYDDVTQFGSTKFFKGEIIEHDNKPLKKGGTACNLIEEGYMIPLAQHRENQINEILGII